MSSDVEPVFNENSNDNHEHEETIVDEFVEEGYLMYRSLPPTTTDLSSYEQNATQALLLFHVNHS